MLLSLLLASSLWVSANSAGSAASTAVVPIEKFADSLQVDLAVNAVGTGLDLISTDWAINRGCVEANPLAPRPEGRVALKIGASALRGSVSYWLRRKGHKTIADVWRYAGFVTDLVITGSNIHCGMVSKK